MLEFTQFVFVNLFCCQVALAGKEICCKGKHSPLGQIFLTIFLLSLKEKDKISRLTIVIWCDRAIRIFVVYVFQHSIIFNHITFYFIFFERTIYTHYRLRKNVLCLLFCAPSLTHHFVGYDKHKNSHKIL